MNIKLVFYNTFTDWKQFEMIKGSRPWNSFLIIAEGSFSFTVGGKEYHVEKDEIACFPQNVRYEREVISPLTFHQFAFMADSHHPYVMQLEAGKLKIPPAHVRSVIETLDLAAKFFASESEEVHCRVIENLLMEHYLYSTKNQKTAVGQDKDVAYVVQYMSEHLSEKINMEEIAESLYLSNAGLIWKFKTYLHQTPAHFLIVLRMQRGKQLLSETRMCIGEIAALCGYSNSYYFSNAFRKYYGVTPSEMRARYKPNKNGENN